MKSNSKWWNQEMNPKLTIGTFRRCEYFPMSYPLSIQSILDSYWFLFIVIIIVVKVVDFIITIRFHAFFHHYQQFYNALESQLIHLESLLENSHFVTIILLLISCPPSHFIFSNFITSSNSFIFISTSISISCLSSSVHNFLHVK